MFTVYLYDNIGHSRDKNKYGYWNGGSHTVKGKKFPIICDDNNGLMPRKYTSVGRAVTGADKARDKFQNIGGYDIEDDNNIVVYRSR